LPEDVILEQQIRQAVRDERYEQAAMLRDKLRELRGDGYKTQR
jgi:protein-arginine kinase activator protein McsA